MKQQLIAVIVLFLLHLVLFEQAEARQETLMLRYPAAHGSQVVFVYGGNLYWVDREKGELRQLTHQKGSYDMLPRFSHRGDKIMFTRQTNQHTEVYWIQVPGSNPVEGASSLATRLTYTGNMQFDDVAGAFGFGPGNLGLGWSPNDTHVIYRTRAYSFTPNVGQLMLAPISGEMGTPLPFHEAGAASFKADSAWLAYNNTFNEFHHWRNYRGGAVPDIMLLNTKDQTVKNITQNKAQDIWPMVWKNSVYFLSDRDGTMNLFEYKVQQGKTRQITHFNGFDIKFPSLCQNLIAFEKGGRVFLYHLKTRKLDSLSIHLNEHIPKQVVVNASQFMADYSISPNGQHLSIAAHGDLWITSTPVAYKTNNPAKVLVLPPHTSKVHERNMRWSPSGKSLAYFSDATGEDELYVLPMLPVNGQVTARQITEDNTDYPYAPVWSPDGKAIAYADNAMNLWHVNVASGDKTLVFHSEDAVLTDFSWAPNSESLVFTCPGPGIPDTAFAQDFGGLSSLWVWNVADNSSFPVTLGWYASTNGTFSADGSSIYFVSRRNFSSILHSNLEMNFAIRKTEQLFKVALEDVELISPNKELSVNLNLIIHKIEGLNVPAGYYGNLTATPGGLYFRYGTGTNQNNWKINFYEFVNAQKGRIEILKKPNAYELSQDRKHMLVYDPSVLSSGIFQKGDVYVLPTPTERTDLHQGTRVNLSSLESHTVVLYELYGQVFQQAWRNMRQFFYVSNMHGTDWSAMYQKYSQLLPYVGHRFDLTFLIGEMVAELNASHAYVGNPDILPVQKSVDSAALPVGVLGGRLKSHFSGYYQVTELIGETPWAVDVQSPLREAGITPGQYILTINGKKTSDMVNLHAALVGKAGKKLRFRVSDSWQDTLNAKQVIVTPLASEVDLIYREWVQQNMDIVNRLSEGKVGYLFVPEMLSGRFSLTRSGLDAFARYFYAQLHKPALIFDIRGNVGGNIAPWVFERLSRELSFYMLPRNATRPSTTPDRLVIGPVLTLVNHQTISNGEFFAYQFKDQKPGSLLGNRTYGAGIGIINDLPLFADGSLLFVPQFGFYDASGSHWIVEGKGVEPDVEVFSTAYPEAQEEALRRAVTIALERLEQFKEGKKVWPPAPPNPTVGKGHRR